MAEAGRALVAHPPGTAFVAVVFVVVNAGFLVKSAAAPFHFWLADAHAVAPTPVCVMFSGVMVELGLFAVARLYWTTFAPAFAAHADAVRELFLCIGGLTSVVGAVYCFGQRHLKRMLAFSTVSHVGLMTTEFALLRPEALAGVATYMVGHACVKGALFLCAGMLLHRYGGVDEFELRGRAKPLWQIGVMMALAALGLAGLPPFATFYGMASVHAAAEAMHLRWLTPVTILAEALTAAAVLRTVARVFLGWGPVREATTRGAPHVPMRRETTDGPACTPAWMWLPAAVLLGIAMLIAVSPAARDAAAAAAAHFEQTHAIAAATLEGRPDTVQPVAAEAAPIGLEHGPTIVITAMLLVLSLRPGLLGPALSRRTGLAVHRLTRPLRRLQSGNIGDYVAWLVLGLAAYSGLLIMLTRSSP